MREDGKQVRAAAARVGLTPEQRIEFGERIHDEKAHDRLDLTWQELIELAEEIKRVGGGGMKATEDIRASRDFAKLNHLVGGLVGQKCLRAELSYADQPVLHFGEPVPYRSKKLSGKARGSWVLEASATPWAVCPLTTAPPARAHVAYWSSAPFATGSETEAAPEAIRAALAGLAGGTVVSAFADGGHLLLVVRGEHHPTAWWAWVADAKPDLEHPAWELLMPGGRFLKVWGPPEPAWSLLPSDRPES